MAQKSFDLYRIVSLTPVSCRAMLVHAFDLQAMLSEITADSQSTAQLKTHVVLVIDLMTILAPGLRSSPLLPAVFMAVAQQLMPWLLKTVCVTMYEKVRNLTELLLRTNLTCQGLRLAAQSQAVSVRLRDAWLSFQPVQCAWPAWWSCSWRTRRLRVDPT